VGFLACRDVDELGRLVSVTMQTMPDAGFLVISELDLREIGFKKAYVRSFRLRSTSGLLKIEFGVQAPVS
jgi:hypothetical protein